MIALVLKLAVIGSALSLGVVGSLLHDRDFITALNTALNAASWYLLIQAQRKLRNDVTPKLQHVEDAVTAVAEQVNTQTPHAVEGGRRKYDPPNGEGGHR